MDRQSDFSGCRGCHPCPGTGWGLCYLGAGPFSSPAVSCLYLPAPADVAGAPLRACRLQVGCRWAAGGYTREGCPDTLSRSITNTLPVCTQGLKWGELGGIKSLLRPSGPRSRPLWQWWGLWLRQPGEPPVVCVGRENAHRVQPPVVQTPHLPGLIWSPFIKALLGTTSGRTLLPWPLALLPDLLGIEGKGLLMRRVSILLRISVMTYCLWMMRWMNIFSKTDLETHLESVCALA